MEIVLSLADKRAVIAEAQRLYDNAVAYIQQPYTGYCFHGTYVGGCGIDWMCGYCESSELGSDPSDFLKGSYRYSLALSSIKNRLRVSQVENWVAEKSATGLKALEVLEVAHQELPKYEAFLASRVCEKLWSAELANN